MIKFPARYRIKFEIFDKYLLQIDCHFCRIEAKRSVTITPALIREVSLTFFNEILEIVKAHNIPPGLIINIDQTPLPYVLISQYTMHKKGEKEVGVLGTDDYRQITGTFSVAMDGSFLPMQLIYKGKTERSLPKYKFPKEFHVTQNPSH